MPACWSRGGTAPAAPCPGPPRRTRAPPPCPARPRPRPTRPELTRARRSDCAAARWCAPRRHRGRAGRRTGSWWASWGRSGTAAAPPPAVAAPPPPRAPPRRTVSWFGAVEEAAPCPGRGPPRHTRGPAPRRTSPPATPATWPACWGPAWCPCRGWAWWPRTPRGGPRPCPPRWTRCGGTRPWWRGSHSPRCWPPSWSSPAAASCPWLAASLGQSGWILPFLKSHKSQSTINLKLRCLDPATHQTTFVTCYLTLEIMTHRMLVAAAPRCPAPHSCPCLCVTFPAWPGSLICRPHYTLHFNYKPWQIRCGFVVVIIVWVIFWLR